MSLDNEVKVSSLKLKIVYNGDKVVTKNIKLKIFTKQHEYFAIGMPRLTFRVQKSNSKANDLKCSDVKVLFNTRKLHHSVSSDFRTCRTIRDIDYYKHLEFNGANSVGFMKNPIAKQKKFTIVLKFTTNDQRKRGSNLYNFPYFAGIEGQYSSDAGFGIGVDNRNAYIWSRMGDGGDLG